MVSRHSRRDDDHGILFPVSWFHAGHRSRDHIAAVPRTYDFRALPEASRRQWRWIYVIGGVICLYFSLFVAVVQAFEKIPALHALAPTQTEPPFKLTQLFVLVIFVVLAIAAAIRFRIEPIRAI
jgi:magnesium-transporting ATPase (P-type)